MTYLFDIRDRVIGYIWDQDLNRASGLQRFLISALRIAYLTVRDVLFDGQLNLRAMSLVYTTLLSMVPLIAVSVSVLKGFGIFSNQIEPLLLNFLIPLGDKGREITAQIITFVDGINSGLLGSLGLALLLYTVVSLMQKIEAAFNFTWHVSEERSFARRFSDYFSVVLIGPVLLFAALGIKAAIAKSAIYQSALSYSLLAGLFGLIEHVLPYLLVILAFTMLYMFIPNTRVRFVPALTGAIVAGLLWQTIGWLFASYVATANYTAIYSVFAALFFFMIWMYISWTILLIGGCISFYYQNPEFRSRKRRTLYLSNRMKEKAALSLMALIATAYYKKQTPPTLVSLAQSLNVASESVMSILTNLMQQGLLIRTDNEPCGYVPGTAPEILPVVDILNAVRRAEEDDIVKFKRLPAIPKVDTVYEQYQSAAKEKLQGIMLRDLLQLNNQDNNLQSIRG